MSESCNHDCGSCSSAGNCATQEELHQKLNDRSKVKKVIGVVSGKGGVGKSTITALMALAASRAGKRTAILDADITGPSIPRVFGVKEKADSDGTVLYPCCSKVNNIQIMSTNLILEHDTDPVIWRGPIIASAVSQFWSDVVWSDVDVMFVDMPPGTGDVALTVFQSLPVDGIIIVTSPQQLVSMIVEKAVKMAQMMNIPILGIVENMSYFQCPDCGGRHNIFGESHIGEVADRLGITRVARLPMDTELVAMADGGEIEGYHGGSVELIAKSFQDIL